MLRIQNLLLTFLLLFSFPVALQAQGGPYEETLAKIRPLIISGNQKQRQKDYDGAIADFNKAIELGVNLPDDLRAGPYLNRGLAYSNKGDLDAALADMDHAVKLNPKSMFGYHDRGEIYRRRNEPEKAIADFTRAIKISDKFESPYKSRGLVLLSLFRDAEAEADFAKFLQLMPAARSLLEKEIAETKAKRSTKP